MANARVPVTLLDGVTGTGAGSTTDLGAQHFDLDRRPRVK